MSESKKIKFRDVPSGALFHYDHGSGKILPYVKKGSTTGMACPTGGCFFFSQSEDVIFQVGIEDTMNQLVDE